MTAPGADSTNGIACAVVFPDRGAMNATTVSSHEAYTAGPGWPPGRISCPSASPASAGLHRARVGAGQRPAQLNRAPGGRQPGQPAHPRVAGQRRHRVSGRRAQPRREPDRPRPLRPRRTPSQDDGRSAPTAAVGVCGQARLAWPVQDVTDEFHAERLRPAPPVTAAAIRAAAQIRPRSATSAQQPASTAQPAAVPPGAVGGPRSQRPAHRGSPCLVAADGLVGVVQIVLRADQGELDRDAEPFAGLDQVLAAAGVAGAGLVGLRR